MTLVDTSAWIAFLRADGSSADAAVRRLLERHAIIQTTDTVAAELLAGASDENDARRLAALVRSLDRCEPPTSLDLERAAELFRTARDADDPVSSLAACLVAATALRDDLDVLSADPDFRILSRIAALRLHGSGDDRREDVTPRAKAAPAIPAEPAAPRGDAADRASTPGTEPRGPTPSNEHPRTLSPTRILVVEDEPSAVRMLQDTLTQPDRTVLVATTAKEARRSIAEDDPNVIVLDLILPDEDGRHLLADLRRDSKAKDTGVVVVTGKAGPRTREECFGLGADWFFDKPFDAAALGRAVEHVIVEGRSTAPDPDPLGVPLTLSEVQKLLSSQSRSGSDTAPFTLALLELDTAPDGSGVPEEARSDGSPDSAPLLPRLLRTVIDTLASELASNELMARWGVDEIVIVSPSRDESAMLALANRIGALPGVSRYLRSRVRRVGRDEDLLDAVSAMASAMTSSEAETDEEAGEPSPGSPEERSPHAQGARPRATLVEDDPVTAGLVRHRLERSGFLVEHHTDGALALAAILERPPHVVILDVQLPSMDGFEILGRLREDPSAEDTPVLMFTSLGRQEHVQRGFELGADDYVTKPFSPTELLTRVLRLVRRR
ncbi:MAG: response regulator [Gemmatimonadota bacterium]